MSGSARRYAVAAVPAAASACFMLWGLLLKALEWYQVNSTRHACRACLLHSICRTCLPRPLCDSGTAESSDIWAALQASVDQVVAVYRWAGFVLFPLLADGAVATGNFLQASQAAMPLCTAALSSQNSAMSALVMCISATLR